VGVRGEENPEFHAVSSLRHRLDSGPAQTVLCTVTFLRRTARIGASSAMRDEGVHEPSSPTRSHYPRIPLHRHQKWWSPHDSVPLLTLECWARGQGSEPGTAGEPSNCAPSSCQGSLATLGGFATLDSGSFVASPEVSAPGKVNGFHLTREGLGLPHQW